MQRLQHFITRIISCGKSDLPVLIQRRQLLQGHLRASKGFTCRVRTLAANLHATSPRNSTRNTPHKHKSGKPSVQTPHIPPPVLGDAQPAHEHEEAGGAGEAKKEDLWEWGWETVGAGNGRMQMWRLR